ncbi:SCO family protein [Opitutus terrae]|uniref:Electron transport protein SCO1/SenC n=1 Tax=Opitutus terrae (strain DSM 11246 / JCM 15787 / PB90-1) TaxID=452637 RepID=B1ZMT2_OPITP|nr:SCO family protein [Opitutus terrae]ACB75360.1 electron transport protein SCO1/SenC [Opitutus terrae PB90-1]
MRRSVLVSILAAWGVVVLAGCGRSETAAQAKPEPGYPLTGEIVEVNPAENVLVVRHDDIPGLMPAMTMEFTATPGDVALAKPGQKIRARLIKAGEGDWRLERIWPMDPAQVKEIEARANALRQETLARGRGVYREIGEKMPEFALYDQEGRVVQSGRFAGKQVMLNFIFTRCPVATMCPASTAKMGIAQKLAREAGVTNLELVSITLDPAYDTPGVLKEYATTRGIDTSNFSFLTGPENAVRDLLAQFGVLAEPDKDDLVKHTLATILIDEKGRIVHRTDGSSWDPKEFVPKMKRG